LFSQLLGEPARSHSQSGESLSLGQFPKLRPSLAVFCVTARRAQKKAASLIPRPLDNCKAIQSNKRRINIP